MRDFWYSYINDHNSGIAPITSPVPKKIWESFIPDKNIAITITDDTLDYLVDKGFDPKMGARPLQRLIDKDIKRKLAREMLFGKLKNGGSLIIDYRDKEVKLDCVEDEITEPAWDKKTFF